MENNLKHRLIADGRYVRGITACLDKPRILVAPTNFCNMACDYCSTKNVRNDKVNMDMELLKSIAGQAVQNGWPLSFGQTYEPFLHPRIAEIVEFVNGLGVRFNSATNGLAIRESCYDLPMSLLLSFSATEQDYAYRNTPVPYEKYLDRQYRFLKHRMKNDVPGVISIQVADYSIFREGVEYSKEMGDIPYIMEKATAIAQVLGVDGDIDGNDWRGRIASRGPLPLYRSGETVIQVQPTKITPNSFDAFMELLKPETARGYCDSCHTMMSIQADGAVAFCCCDPTATAIAGTLDAGTDLRGFWHGKEMQAVREGFAAFAPVHDFCTQCLENVSEHIKPLLTVHNPKVVAEVLKEFGVTENLPWFTFPSTR